MVAPIRAIVEAGAVHGIAPYGTEALGVMRIEKGHAAGPELNGQTTAHDLGLGRTVSKKKDIGRLFGQRPALTKEARPSLVGLQPVELVGLQPVDKTVRHRYIPQLLREFLALANGFGG